MHKKGSPLPLSTCQSYSQCGRGQAIDGRIGSVINLSMSPSEKGFRTTQLRSSLDLHYLAKCWILIAMPLKAWHYSEK